MFLTFDACCDHVTTVRSAAISKSIAGSGDAILSVWSRLDFYACAVGIGKTTFHVDTSLYRTREMAAAPKRMEQSLQEVHQIPKAET